MATYVALLRGINVGGNRIIKMADLREMFAAAGARDVETYIQSGNVVFGHAARSAAKLAADLERQIAKDTGFAVPVVLRTADELGAVIAANPFAKADTDHLHVFFVAAALPVGALSAVDARAFHPERFGETAREVYLHLPDGLGRSKLAGAVMKVKSMAAATARNWRTVLTLNEMAAGRQRR
jgi:uncharacterized protein (DUF1697 family)